MRSFFIAIFCGVLFGCASTSIPDVEFTSMQYEFDSQHEAAIAFYDNHSNVILELMPTQNEIIGLILKCKDKYVHTDYHTSGLYNPFFPVVKGRCKMHAIAHTHPDLRGNQNQFSGPDLLTSNNIDVYLQSPDMKIRHAKKSEVTVIRH